MPESPKGGPKKHKARLVRSADVGVRANRAVRRWLAGVSRGGSSKLSLDRRAKWLLDTGANTFVVSPTDSDISRQAIIN